MKHVKLHRFCCPTLNTRTLHLGPRKSSCMKEIMYWKIINYSRCTVHKVYLYVLSKSISPWHTSVQYTFYLICTCARIPDSGTTVPRQFTLVWNTVEKSTNTLAAAYIDVNWKWPHLKFYMIRAGQRQIEYFYYYSILHTFVKFSSKALT